VVSNILGRTTLSPATEINYPLFNTWQVVIDRTLFTQMRIFSLPEALSSLPTNFRDATKQVICLPRPTPWFFGQTTSSHFVCDLQMKGHSFTEVYLRHSISAHPFGCRLHNSPPSPDGLSCRMPLCWCAARVLWFLHNLFPYLILLTRTVTMFSCISVSSEYR